MINAPVAYLITAFVCAAILGYAVCGFKWNETESGANELPVESNTDGTE